MFKSVETKVNMVKAMKDYRVVKGTRAVSNDKWRVPKDELPRGIMQSNGKLKSC